MSELIVGTNSYVTLEEAEQYIADYYLTTDNLRIQWNSLPTEDKQTALRKSARLIDALPLVGRKATNTQTMAFPRIRRGPMCLGAEAGAIPQEVKDSQVEQTLFSLDSVAANQVATRAALQRQGVSSFTLGDLSESYGGNTLASYTSYVTSSCSNKVLVLLSDWLSGGFRVCRYLPGT